VGNNIENQWVIYRNKTMHRVIDDLAYICHTEKDIRTPKIVYRLLTYLVKSVGGWAIMVKLCGKDFAFPYLTSKKQA
jgi:hypothetical protein